MAEARTPSGASRTLYDKLWDAHVVADLGEGQALLYIDRHLVHEVTSPQAFDGLRLNGRKPWRLDANLAVADHNVPTTDRSEGIADPISRAQVDALDANCAEYGITEFRMSDLRQGIVHVIGPEQGATLPGMTVVCGDSHTSTHGAFGALAFGIGTSEVEHVLATQTLMQRKSKNMRVTVRGQVAPGITAKDIVLAIIGRIGTAGGNGHTIEFAGEAIAALSMEGRMTVCNMAIEAGARAGLVAVDQTTIGYVQGRPYSPKGAAWDKAVAWWNTLHSDEGAHFDREVTIEARDIKPQVTWGTSPEMVVPVDGRVPDPAQEPDATAWSGRCSTWAWPPTRRSSRSASTRCSSAPAPIRASRICAPRRRWSAASASPPTSSWRWWCRARAWSSSKPRRKGWTACSARPASSGASRAARCAWA